MQLFADEWLTGAHTGKRFNGVKAYEYAGYKLDVVNPSANPSKLLRHPDVAEYIRKRMDEYAMSAEEVLLRFTAIARSEVGDVVKIGPNGHLMIDPEAVLENKEFIKSFGFDSNGNPKVEFHDALAALRDIARIKGQFKDGLELSGAGGAPVTMQVVFVDAQTGQNIEIEGQEKPEVEPEDFSEFDEA